MIPSIELKSKSHLFAAVAIMMAGALVSACAPAAQDEAPAVQDETAAVLAANAQFYAALDSIFTGDVGPMETIWSHADDVTYMGPTGGFEHGWAAVIANWQSQAAMMLGGHVESADMQLVVGRDLAIVSNYEMGENTNAGGEVEQVKLRATNIFRKEDGQWKMIGHHTDTLPYLVQ